MQLLHLRPIRLLFVVGVLVVGILIIPLIWIGFHYAFGLVQPLTERITESLNTNTTTYTQVDTFFQTIDSWIPVMALLALMVFCIVYAHRRGAAT